MRRWAQTTLRLDDLVSNALTFIALLRVPQLNPLYHHAALAAHSIQDIALALPIAIDDAAG
jgi:hypothetical protein